MSAADDRLLAQAEEWGDELDTPTLTPGQTVHVRLLTGLPGQVGTGRVAVDEDGRLVVEVYDCQPAARMRALGGAA